MLSSVYTDSYIPVHLTAPCANINLGLCNKQQCREYGKEIGGPFLFGRFSIADAM